MKLSAIKKSIVTAGSKVVFQTKKHSPELLLIGGLVFGVTCVVKACQATTKAAPVLQEAKSDVDAIHEAIDAAANEETVNYPVETAKKDLTRVYIRTGGQLAKLYAPAVGFGILAGGCVLGGHRILKKRNIALAAAYTAVDSAFKEYSGRVKELVGDEVEQDLRHGIVAKTIKKQLVDDNGEVHDTEETIKVVDGDPDQPGGYARYFDERCRGVWKPNHELNLMTLRCEQQYANDLLVTNRVVFLNDVNRRLGLPETVEGQQVGWIYDPNDPNGDNHINFRIREVCRKKTGSLTDEYEPVIMIDPNVDGPIFQALVDRGIFPKH